MRRRRAAGEPDPYSFGSRPYDLVKEFVVALCAVALLTFVLAGVFSSPDEKPMSIAAWAKADPGDFTATALAELDGSSDTAGYGPPYNSAAEGQKLGPLTLAKTLGGVTHPIDTAQAFVLAPLENSSLDHDAAQAVAAYTAATSDQQGAWTSGYSDALTKADGDPAKVATGDYGPVPALLSTLLSEARAGSLDSALLAEGGFYRTDYTLPLLFLADGSDLSARAQSEHLAGNQWGMMNEIGDYPGQVWLLPYTFWYQISPYKTSGNGDALVWGTMGILGAALVLLPVIPGLRSVPRLIPVYRLIWRQHYRDREASESTA